MIGSCRCIMAMVASLEPDSAMPNHIDIALIVVVALVLPLVDLWLYPRFVRAVTKVQSSTARSRFYLFGIVIQWTLTLCVLSQWLACRRPLSSLGLGAPNLINVAIGFSLTTAFLFLLRAQRRAILSRPNSADLIRQMLGTGAAIIPRTQGERVVFAMLAVTAGICEEVLFRGLINYCFIQWGGLISGLIGSSIAFGFAHIYLGAKDFRRTAVTGAILWIIVLASGSLWFAMVIHAAMDLLAGDLGFRAFQSGSSSSDSPNFTATNTSAD